jgi:hypothetical protein
MRLTQVLGGQVVQLAEPNRTKEGRKKYYLYDVVRAIEARYRFLRAPRDVGEYDLTQGIKFQNGLFNESHIDKFDVYTNGLLCEGGLQTEQLHQFLEDLFLFVEKEFAIPPLVGIRAYASSLEVHSEIDLSNLLKPANQLGRRITEFLRSYGQSPAEFTLERIGLHGDQTDVPFPKVNHFLFERRAGTRYSEHLYFSGAPLKTADHLAVLSELEAIFS